MVKRSTGKVGRPKNPPSHKEVLKTIIPIKDIFTEEEESIYNALVDVYLEDFDEGDLTSSDMDDILSMSMNRVLEIRLLKESKGKTNKQLDVSTAIEKLRKQTEKIKENLSSRRRDRIDPNRFKGFSIVDLAVAFDDDRKSELEEKSKELKKEEELFLKTRGDYVGNKYDIDTDTKQEDDD